MSTASVKYCTRKNFKIKINKKSNIFHSNSYFSSLAITFTDVVLLANGQDIDSARALPAAATHSNKI